MKLPRLNPQRSAVLLIDFQQRLLPVMRRRSTVIRRTQRLIEGASILGLPVVVTEQYPRGLGPTHESISAKLHGAVYTDPKTRFSAFGPSLQQHLEKFEVQSVVVAGVEAHVCVLLTCLDLIDAGYTVAVCQDAVSSRRDEDRSAALARMQQAGVLPATVESVLFELMGDADSPHFKAMRAVIQSDEG